MMVSCTQSTEEQDADMRVLDEIPNRSARAQIESEVQRQVFIANSLQLSPKAEGIATAIVLPGKRSR